MNPCDLQHLNSKEIDEQYKKYEGIVSNDDIGELMDIYNIDESTLSLILGFKKETISGYFRGLIPTKDYSDIIKKAISSPDYFLDMLENNKNKIKESVYDNLKNNQ